MARLTAALMDSPSVEAIEAGRALLNRVVVMPKPAGGSPEVEVVGELQALLAAGGAETVDVSAEGSHPGGPCLFGRTMNSAK